MPAYEKSAPVVPVVAIFGGNAAGKSNLLDALRFMQTAVRRSFGQWESGAGVPRTPFRLDAAALAEPSTFAVDLLLDGAQYVYGFEVDDSQVTSEWLYRYGETNRRSVVFEREERTITLGDSLPERVSRTKTLDRVLRDNALLLSAATQVGEQPEFVPVYRWFQTGVLVPRVDPLRIRTVLPRRIEQAVDTPGFVDLVRAADMDIVDVRVEETREPVSERSLRDAEMLEGELRQTEAALAAAESDEQKAQRVRQIGRLRELRDRMARPRVRREVIFVQGDNAVPMTIDEQSAGTVAYIDLVAHALKALASGGALVMDELDMSLHPRLIARLVELFRSAQTNPHTAQLIFNTHDATLLGTSFGTEILRRDEIWFVDKRDGATALYPLTDFHPRQEDNREKRYLGGSYGGVPAVFSDTLVESLLESREEANGGAS
jgi:hypothetical protein